MAVYSNIQWKKIALSLLILFASLLALTFLVICILSIWEEKKRDNIAQEFLSESGYSDFLKDADLSVYKERECYSPESNLCTKFTYIVLKTSCSELAEKFNKESFRVSENKWKKIGANGLSVDFEGISEDQGEACSFTVWAY